MGYVSGPWTPSGAHDLVLQTLELGVVDRALIAEVGEMRDLLGRSGRGARGIADVRAIRGVCPLRVVGRVHTHVTSAGDEVDEHAEVRRDDHERDPEELRETPE